MHVTSCAAIPDLNCFNGEYVPWIVSFDWFDISYENNFDMLAVLLSNDKLEVLLSIVYENVMVAFAVPGSIAL